MIYTAKQILHQHTHKQTYTQGNFASAHTQANIHKPNGKQNRKESPTKLIQHTKKYTQPHTKKHKAV